MTKEEFIETLKECAEIAIERSNEYLDKIYDGLCVSIDWEYDTWDLDYEIGVYESGSVFEGEIYIGMNVDNLYKYTLEQLEEFSFVDAFTIIREATMTNVYHEVGHGIVELFEDYLNNSDDLDELYDNNQQLFDWVLDNEEDAVEEFAWLFYDNELEKSRLNKMVQLYIKLYESYL